MTDKIAKRSCSVDLIAVEDSVVDVKLVVDAMQVAGLTTEVRCVTDEQAFRAALDERTPDAILSCWTLPGFSGQRALEIAHEYCPGTPFIFVSGTMPESSAIEMLRRGASDYIYKHQLHRLAPALSHALGEARAQRSLVESEASYRSLFDNMLNGFAYCRMLFENGQPSDFIYLSVNQAFEIMTGLKDVTGKKASEVIPGIRESNRDLMEIYGRVARTGNAERFETYVAPLGIWFAVSAYSHEPEHFSAIFDVITERKQLEQALLRKNAMYAVLSSTNKTIIRVDDQQELFDRVCRIALELGGFCLAWIGVVNETEQRVIPVALAGPASDYVPAIVVHCCQDLPTGQGPTGIAIRENRHVVINDFMANPMTAPWHDIAARYGIRSSLTLPIRGHGIRGALMVYSTEPDYFQQDAVDLLLEVTGDISFALGKIQTAEQLRCDEAQLRLHAQVFDKSSEGMVITDADNNIIMANQAYLNLTGYTLEEMRGKNPRIMKSGKHDREFYLHMWESILTTGFWQGEMWDRNKQGEIYPVWATINAIKNDAGEVINYFAVHSDLSQKRAVEQLHHLQRYDALTDLPNRLLLEDRVAGAINHARQYGRHVAMLFVNLDHFHSVNDLLGHAAGDQVLRSIAARIADRLDAQATVSRFSGDTFVVVLPDINQADEINEVNLIAEVLLDAISVPLCIGEQDLELSGRIGIAVYPNDGESFAELAKNADLAVLQAKENGRNSYCYFTPAMNVHSMQLLTMRGELRQALKNNWFVLHYQPQVNILSGQIIGCEALIRIQHPKRGLIPPMEFISVAEETGLIVPIGEWVIQEACTQMKRWQDEGHDDIVMAVNVSPLQFRQPNLIAVIREALDKAGLEPQFLELEFTEGALMRNVASTMELMRNLKQMGLRLTIDDFGTGYSSLNYLKQFPVDKLKIDQSFVQNIAHDPNDASIVQAVIAIARSLGLSTIAEGVETEAQLGYLRSLHCNEIQGFYYGQAVPPDEFTALLQQEHEVVREESANTLLLVDDEENVLMALKRILRREGYNILTATSAEEGLEILAKNNVSVLLSDQRMPGMSGVEFLRRVKLMYPDVVRMILSGYTEVGTLTDAINKGEIYQFITKPWENEMVIASIREGFLRHESLKKAGSS